MKVAVLGASGIIGQHLRLCQPPGVTATYARREADPLHVGVDLTDEAARDAFLLRERPDVIINLAGESNTDRVERNSPVYERINAVAPVALAVWCEQNGSHLLQVSSQAVFDGTDGPYRPDSQTLARNCYGSQKSFAEYQVARCKSSTIVRPTFVLGVRPLPFVGRANPIEHMLAGGPQKQVYDRWFSVSFARDVAARLWEIALERPAGKIFHIGSPVKMSRFDLASLLLHGVEPVKHDSFPGLAPRPIDTTYAPGSGPESLAAGLEQCERDYDFREAMALPARAREIALFLGKREDDCIERLNQGWDLVHNAVSDDWRASNPKSEWQILEWYRRTEAYIWELSLYHADPGWNYSGMCKGIAERLGSQGGVKRVLCLGDGVGDLTLSLIRAGFDAEYNDLAGSRTAEFALFRSWVHLGRYMPTRLTNGWRPDIGAEEYDAIVSLDFLEHVPNVEEWAAAIKRALKPGGLFCAQNAFAAGSGESGAMPMHLAKNDRFERDWDPTLFGLGFQQLSSNWYMAPAEIAVSV